MSDFPNTNVSPTITNHLSRSPRSSLQIVQDSLEFQSAQDAEIIKVSRDKTKNTFQLITLPFVPVANRPSRPRSVHECPQTLRQDLVESEEKRSIATSSLAQLTSAHTAPPPSTVIHIQNGATPRDDDMSLSAVSSLASLGQQNHLTASPGLTPRSEREAEDTIGEGRSEVKLQGLAVPNTPPTHPTPQPTLRTWLDCFVRRRRSTRIVRRRSAVAVRMRVRLVDEERSDSNPPQERSKE